MKFSEKWLREWVNPSINTQALADQLTMAGLETESLTPVAGNFSHVIIGQIVEAVQHPKADRLRVCQVNVGADALLNIVCGAPNARAGIKVAVAMIGAVLPNGMEIKRAKLRDVESEGMLCSFQELGINELSEGIIELPEDAPLGQDVRDYLDLNDTIIELSITPNRGDCLSILGIAREIAALTHCSMAEYAVAPIAETISDTHNVHIQHTQGCGSYFGRIIKNVNAQIPVPRWLSDRVKRSGTRSISSIVDVTNYVLNELGQPLHAFDLDTLQGDVCVRLSEKDETIELLDGQTVTLKPGTLMIADEKGPIAMAGIMGGLRTAVTENTKNVFLESAWFAPTTIAGKARQYGISTDAAHRFERGVDPTIQQKALTRATNLILEICGGNAGPETSASESTPSLSEQSDNAPVITLNIKSIERLLGISVDHTDINHFEKSFNALGLTVLSKSSVDNAGQWEVQIPPHRSDITIEADLIEEAARIYGYQRIPTTPLTATLTTNHLPENRISPNTFCDTLIARGYHEIISYSFVNAEKQASLYPEGESLSLLNPISSEYSDMRKGLWAGLIEAALYNQNRQTLDVRLFEQGTRFIIEKNKITEKAVLAGLCMGNYVDLQWNQATRPCDFYDIKGDVETLLSLSHINKNYTFKAASHPALHPGQTAEILCGIKTEDSTEKSISEKSIGWIGALHPELGKKWGLDKPVYLFELDLEQLSETAIPEYQKLSKFPSIRRDISFLIDTKFTANDVLDCIKQQDNTLLHHVQIFDVYQGKNVAENQKSFAVALMLQHPERTLVETEVNELMDKVLKALEKSFSVTLRQ